MTNAPDSQPTTDGTIDADPDFDLEAELEATEDWDDDRSGSRRAEIPRTYRPPARWTWPSGTQLRRVAGLRTELEDITEVEYRQLRLERVVLVGVWTEGTIEDAENSMAELALLAETAGSEVLEAIYQRRQSPDPATYVGRGKVEGIARDRRRPPAPTP